VPDCAKTNPLRRQRDAVALAALLMLGLLSCADAAPPAPRHTETPTAPVQSVHSAAAFRDCGELNAYAQDHARELVAAAPLAIPFNPDSSCPNGVVCDPLSPRGLAFDLPAARWLPIEGEPGGAERVQLRTHAAQSSIFGLAPGGVFIMPLAGARDQLRRFQHPRLEDARALFVGSRRMLVVGSARWAQLPEALRLRAWNPAGATAVSLTSLHELEWSESGQIRLVRTRYVEGEYLGARDRGRRVRVAIASWPRRLGWQSAGHEVIGGFEADAEADVITAREHNHALIAGADAQQWLPQYLETGVDDAPNPAPRALLECDQVLQPAVRAGLGVVSVLDIDVDEGLPSQHAIAVLASGATLASSGDALYIATQPWQNLSRAWLRPDDNELEPVTQLRALQLQDSVLEDLGSQSLAGTLVDIQPFDHAFLAITRDELPGDNRFEAASASAWLVDEGPDLPVLGHSDALTMRGLRGVVRVADDVYTLSGSPAVRSRSLHVAHPMAMHWGSELPLESPYLAIHSLPDGRALAVERQVDESYRLQGSGRLHVIERSAIVASADLGDFTPSAGVDERVAFSDSQRALVVCGERQGPMGLMEVCPVFRVEGRTEPVVLGVIEPPDSFATSPRTTSMLVEGDAVVNVTLTGVLITGLAPLATRTWAPFEP
jgi:hypothetical protein